MCSYACLFLSLYAALTAPAHMRSAMEMLIFISPWCRPQSSRSVKPCKATRPTGNQSQPLCVSLKLYIRLHKMKNSAVSILRPFSYTPDTSTPCFPTVRLYAPKARRRKANEARAFLSSETRQAGQLQIFFRSAVRSASQFSAMLLEERAIRPLPHT